MNLKKGVGIDIKSIDFGENLCKLSSLSDFFTIHVAVHACLCVFCNIVIYSYCVVQKFDGGKL